MSKLTLSVDDRVIERAKRYAARRSTSVSRLVEQYLDTLSRSPAKSDHALPPVLARLRAEWKGAAVDGSSYREYLTRKYR